VRKISFTVTGVNKNIAADDFFISSIWAFICMRLFEKENDS